MLVSFNPSVNCNPKKPKQNPSFGIVNQKWLNEISGRPSALGRFKTLVGFQIIPPKDALDTLDAVQGSLDAKGVAGGFQQIMGAIRNLANNLQAQAIKAQTAK